jgi:hypothetical protein
VLQDSTEDPCLQPVSNRSTEWVHKTAQWHDTPVITLAMNCCIVLTHLQAALLKAEKKYRFKPSWENDTHSKYLSALLEISYSAIILIARNREGLCDVNCVAVSSEAGSLRIC